jgi:acetyltransferase-like isoleucine patch superfamily enzyme
MSSERVMNRIYSRLARKLRPKNPSALPPGCRLDLREDLKQFSIGRYTRGHLTVSSRTPGATLEIGQFCSLAHGAHVLLGGEHRADFVTMYRFPAYPEFRDHVGHLTPNVTATRGSVSIGNDVWLGNDVMVLSGVVIGNGAVIGAGSVVRQAVPPFAIVAGNPARVAGFRFPPEQIVALQRIAWWDWPIERIVGTFELLLSDGIQDFIDQYDVTHISPTERDDHAAGGHDQGPTR